MFIEVHNYCGQMNHQNLHNFHPLDFLNVHKSKISDVPAGCVSSGKVDTRLLTSPHTTPSHAQ